MTNIAVEMEEPFTNDRGSFQRCLEAICKTISENDPENDAHPFRLQVRHLLQEELRGECYDWSLRYLGLHKCPPTLAAAIAKEVYDELVKIDFKEFEENSIETELETKKGEEMKENEEIVRPESVLDASLLFDHVLDLIEDVCQKWKNDLPEITVPDYIHQCYCHEIKNTRRKMEDRHVMLPDFNTLFDLRDDAHQSYYAVFDGHAGIDAAVYASNYLHTHLPTCQKFATDPASALKCSYNATDEKFIAKAQREGLKSGSTGVSVFIREKTMYVAWLGDSQACLVRNGQSIPLMEPHKPEREDEKSRIEALGGCVVFMGTWRVNGNLAVSRAIGDISQKKYITSDADTTVIELDGTEDYVVLACDGLWDGISQESLPKLVYDHLLETNGDKSSVARKLVTVAKENGSTDNITAIIVFLRDVIAPPFVPQTFNFGSVSNSQGSDATDDDKDKERESKDQEEESSKGSNCRQSASSDRKPTDTHQEQAQLHKDNSQNGNDIHSLSKNDTDTLLPVGHILKKEPVFIIGEVSPNSTDKTQDSSSFKSESKSIPADDFPLKDKVISSEVSNPEDKINPSEVETPTDALANKIKPSDIINLNSDAGKTQQLGISTFMYLPSQGSTISEFRRGLKESSSLSNSLVPVPENHVNVPVVSNYSIQQIDEKNRKKEALKRRVRKSRNSKAKTEGREGNYVTPRRGKKKLDGSAPVIWSFTGKNTASVKNYKLNYASKNPQNTSRVVLANILNNSSLESSIPSQTSSDIKYLEKMSKSKHFHDQDQQNVDELPMPHTVFDYPLSTFTSSSPNPKTKSTSKSQSQKTTSSASDPKTIPAFHQSWRPRKFSKQSSTVLCEPPPTPFTNVKLNNASQQ